MVGELAAGLRIERRAVEHELDLVAGAEAVDDLAVADQAAEPGVGDDLVVAGELDLAAERVGDATVDARVAVRRTSSRGRRPWRGRAAPP